MNTGKQKNKELKIIRVDMAKFEAEFWEEHQIEYVRLPQPDDRCPEPQYTIIYHY